MILNQDTVSAADATIIEQSVAHLSSALVYWFSQPLDPSRRFFWLFLLSSALLAIGVSWFDRKKAGGSLSFSALLNIFFNKRYWLHRSTLVDVSLSMLNTVIRFALLVPIIGSHLWLTLWTAKSLLAWFDTPVMPDLPWYSIAALYSLTFFVLEDLSRFLLHRAMHGAPWLWRFHRVHHSATILTPLTLQRVHPVEMTLYYLRGIIVFGTVSGVFLYLFANDLTTWDVLGVDLLGFAFAILGANLRHSHVWLSFGRFERWFISPAQHQLHHSSAAEHQNKNYGSYLSCWDRWSRTLIFSGKKRRLMFGLSQR